jgi:hypothetical protein
MPISASNEFSIIGLGKIGGVLAAQALEKGAPETKTLVGIGSGLPSSFPRLLTCSGGGPGDLSMHPSSRIKRPDAPFIPNQAPGIRNRGLLALTRLAPEVDRAH